MNRILIDTYIFSAVIRGKPEVVDVLRGVVHSGFSAMSIGELLSGFKAGNRKLGNRKRLG